MLLHELKKVIEIDDKISSLHRELSSLYNERAQYMSTPGAATSMTTPRLPAVEADTFQDLWLETTYAQLAAAWQKQNITIPSCAQLKKRLVKARSIMAALEALAPDYKGNLTILLVPPSSHLGFPSSQDVISEELLMRTPTHKHWQVLVTYAGPEALAWGPAADILSSQMYKLGSYDLRGLGMREYAALARQLGTPIDSGKWVSLLKGIAPDAPMTPSVTFYAGQYRFMLDDSRGVLGDEQFRPAVVVKA